MFFVAAKLVSSVSRRLFPHLRPNSDPESLRLSWLVRTENPGVQRNGFGWAVEKVVGVMRSLATVGTRVEVGMCWVYPVEMVVEVGTETRGIKLYPPASLIIFGPRSSNWKRMVRVRLGRGLGADFRDRRP